MEQKTSIFTKIIEREIPAHIVAETAYYIAFLDINPLKKGHLLCVPKVQVDYLFDLDEVTYQGLHAFVAKVAKALKKAVSCERIGTAVLGFEVPHCHIHLVPMDDINDLNFANPKLKFSDEELKTIASDIKAAFEG